MKETILKLKEQLNKIHPLPWVFPAKYPFDIQVDKPRHSLSKHTDKNKGSWHYDDGLYLATCVNEMPNILKYVWEFEDKIEKLEKELANVPCTNYRCSINGCDHE